MEKILGIPRATIRFYEKEGLISPQREENGYRDYSQDDLQKVKKIIVLRKIGLPVNEIADIFDGARSLPEISVCSTMPVKHMMYGSHVV